MKKERKERQESKKERQVGEKITMRERREEKRGKEALT